MENELKKWYELHKFYRYSSYLTKELAEYLQVSPRTIQRWIEGKTHPKKKKLNLIKEYLEKNATEASKGVLKRKFPDKTP